jgi:hypothetical protein
MKTRTSQQFRTQEGKLIHPTIGDLASLFLDLLKEGHGNEKVYMSCDEEGNAFGPVYALEYTRKGRFDLFPRNMEQPDL